MPRTLQPGDQISRYRIVGPLGAGGMGEVYRARDQSLDRDVALKILPLELVRSEERVRRFVLEAKSASSLNHPNIITIYEIGEQPMSPAGDGGGTPGGNGGQGSVHFISMEMVAGETLGHKIHEERTDLKTLLGWLAQAADGIAKAHAAGIVHRDLKPGNIMISSDGYAKVLDFGLAKLTEKMAADQLQSTAPTELGDRTAEGVVLGTAAYMCPEQVVGKPVDHRGDIFSFGCILYEAATRRRPFAADSTVETMHQILNDKPTPIEELNPNVPAELRRLIRRCLAKNPEQRLQSMKDLSIELREIVDEYDNLSASAGSGSGSGTIAALPTAPRRFPIVPVAAAAIVLVSLAIGFWGFRRGGRAGPVSAPAIHMSTLTSRGDVSDPVISPDGRYLAYMSGPIGDERLWVRQIATGSDIQILGPQQLPPTGLTFSPDGNYVYYLSLDPEHQGYRALYQVPSLGGSPVKKGYDIDTPVAFAPDGTHYCFMRGYPAEHATKLIVRDLESGTERIVASVASPFALTQARPAWSPDGRTIAALEDNTQDSFKARVVLFRASDGKPQKFASPTWPQVNSMAWAPDGRSFIVVGYETAGDPRFQITSVSYPDGRVRPITSGFDSYGSVSLTQDGQMLTALRNSPVSNIWTIDTSTPTPALKQLTFATNIDNSAIVPWPADNGTIVFQSPSNQRISLWTIGMDGSGRKQLTSGPGADYDPYPVPGGVIFQRVGPDLVAHIWRVDNDGGNAKALTSGPGEKLVDVSRDGQWILFARANKEAALCIMPAAGGDARELVGDYQSNAAGFSPDGRLVAYSTVRDIGGVIQFTAAVVQAADGHPLDMRRLPPQSSNIIWSDDGPSLIWIHRGDPYRNLFRQRIDQSPPEQITHFTDGRVVAFLPSPDGRRLAVARQVGAAQNVWLVDPTGVAAPVQATSFSNGTFFSAHWTADSRVLTVAYGALNRDAVLIRDFQ